MYIDFPLEGNTPNPRAKSLGRRPHIFRPPSRRPSGGVGPWLEQICGWGPWGRKPPANPPKSGLVRARKLLRPLEEPWGGPLRPRPLRPWRLRPLEAPGGPGAGGPEPRTIGGFLRPLQTFGGKGPWGPGGPWRPGCWRQALQPGRRRTSHAGLEASGGPAPLAGGPCKPACDGPSFSWKEQEDDLFEVGIEGVALNPNRK